MERKDTGWEITESHLDVTARIPGADTGKLEAAANDAKAGCPVSRLLNAKITMEARLAATA
jgi:osmotically inducible protein OsmC